MPACCGRAHHVEVIAKEIYPEKFLHNCPIFPNIESVIHIQDLKHAKKTSYNAIISGACLLTLGRNINSSKLAKLYTWLSDIDIATTIKHSYKLAYKLAKALGIDLTSSTNNSLLLLFVIIKIPDLEISTRIKSNSEFENDLNEFFEIDKEISYTISQAFKYTTEAINDIFDSLNIEILMIKFTKHKLFQF
ncbi:7571_t:CDS:2 [Racocetra persica]|uniref:7571_t:CDS:1 n=1 Tax=Racocetra persica TaxID=160502 RepID=A0ACA9L006_9GLOM|nr:7571_t:CDS:2 [Racocetra persica]